jgi:hypothetical protein
MMIQTNYHTSYTFFPCVASPMCIAANCSWSFVYRVIILCVFLLPYVYCFTVCIVVLAYADDVNILGGSAHTVKENAEALLVATKEIGLK